MARFLALDWDHQQLHVVEATLVRGTVRVQRAAVWQEEKSPNPAEAEALAKTLRERLQSAGIAAAPVLVCVGRDRVILKEVRYPAVSAQEEPAIVRFQAAKELADPAEEVIIDYVTVGEGRAQALVLRRELLGVYQTLCRAAGLKLACLTPRPFGAIASLQHAEGPTTGAEAVGLLTLTQAWAEFCITRQGQILLTRSLPVTPALAGEIRRNLNVYAGQAPQAPVKALYLAGNGNTLELREKLQSQLGIPVYLHDPFAGQDRAERPTAADGGFVAPLGLLLHQASGRAMPIDFAKPKEPKPARDPNKRRALIAAGVAAAVLTTLCVFAYERLAAKDRLLEGLFLQKAALDAELIQIEEEAKRIKAVEDWAQTDINWLDELYDLTDRFPELTNIRLTALIGDPLPHTGKDKHVAKMTLKGITTDDFSAVDTVMRHLVEDGHYRVEPKTMSPNTGQERFRFRQQFTTRVDLERLAPDKFVRRLPPPPEDKRRSPGEFFSEGGMQ